MHPVLAFILIPLILIGFFYGAYEVYLSLAPPAPALRIFPGLFIDAKVRGTDSFLPFPIPEKIGNPGGIWKAHVYDGDGLNGFYPLYTTDRSGLIHVVSKVARNYTLGDFFAVWGQTLNSTQVLSLHNGSDGTWTMIVNGQPSNDWGGHMLKDGEIIRLRYA